MKKYVFYDTDITGHEEYDIKNEDYRNLIRFCSDRCLYFSLLKTVPEDPVSLALAKYAISRPYVCPEPQKRYTYLQSEFQPYDIFNPVCDDSISIVMQLNSVFSYFWDGKCACAQDLTFYRSDGSILFSSITHEGNCTLYLTKQEEKEWVLRELWHEE